MYLGHTSRHKALQQIAILNSALAIPRRANRPPAVNGVAVALT